MTKKTIEELLNQPAARAFNIEAGQLRVSDTKGPQGRVSGVAVPYGVTTDRAGFYPERIAKNAVINVVSAENPLPLRFEHRDTIGIIDGLRNTDDGCVIDAQILPTSLGKDVIILVEGLGVRSFSIGFWPRHGTQDTESGEITWDEIELFEVSAVTLPAYQTAAIESLRAAALAETTQAAVEATTAAPAVETTEVAPATEITTPNPEVREDATAATGEKEQEMTKEITDALEALRTSVDGFKGNDTEAITRGLATTNDRLDELVRSLEPIAHVETGPDTRSIGALQRAMYKGDNDALQVIQNGQTRAFADESGVVADVAQLPTYLQRSIKIQTDNSPIANEFASEPLPINTTHIAYKVLKSNTIVASKQENEGDDLVKGKLTFENKYAEVETIGGWTEMSMQEVLLGNSPTGVNIVNRVYDALSAALGKTTNSRVRTALVDTYTENVNTSSTGGHTPKVSGTDFLTLKADPAAKDIISVIVDAAGVFSDRGNNLNGLIVPRALFKTLATATGTDGRTILNVYGDGVNNIGEVSATALGGNIGGLRVIVDPSSDWTGKAVFFDREAIRQYASQGYTLQSKTIVNLAEQISAFKFLALAVENAGGVVPLKFS